MTIVTLMNNEKKKMISSFIPMIYSVSSSMKLSNRKNFPNINHYEHNTYYYIILFLKIAWKIFYNDAQFKDLKL